MITGKSRGAVSSGNQNTTQALFGISGSSIGGYTYLPYGWITVIGTVAGLNPFRWIGRPQLPASDYYLTNRYYYLGLLRFTQPDPSGQELNPYTYATGDPINRSDPSGLIAECTAAILGQQGMIIVTAAAVVAAIAPIVIAGAFIGVLS
ncbi:RHS repeat-associated core domain-containing protein [Saccharopolyspora sp. HNM0983]|uniref:RHS repeat-associated core domain-containing protein n=1 Tax=Saccharopolyspora montiporae TaxID=2781240 RepID=A0A929G1N1_9PSEU|nr:RHS repeat-associated core domain-containing protein [Saccharopolyspora sp. HNM0983]